MTDFIEWDGSEGRLEQLLIWWGTQIPWEHSPNCDGGRGSMHCCEGIYEFDSPCSIEGSSCATAHADQRVCMQIFFSDGHEKREVEIGDRIYYDGAGMFRLEKK